MSEGQSNLEENRELRSDGQESQDGFQSTESSRTDLRKPMGKRSLSWGHFTVYFTKDKKRRAQCTRHKMLILELIFHPKECMEIQVFL
ncbi:unnamed protein product [Cuscuta campestris]|uniref:Uncharacterized protein n=1 Tax=Cuscuta campestris TaxID=132261 RepID=A0A484KEE1_9ASTE|nr:unnamed protein product [Cuscuta campestris]